MTREPELQCYCGPRQTLALTEEGGLCQWCCRRCGGRRFLLADFRRWREQGGAQQLETGLPAAATEYHETPSSRLCQSCGQIMARYRVAGDLAFHVDRCAPCQSVWLDGCEWEILASQHRLAQLDEIMSDRWQKRLQQSEADARREQTLRTRFGDAEYERLREISLWLARQTKRREMLAFLNAEPPAGAERPR